MELTYEIFYLTIALISLGFIFPAYLSAKHSKDVNNSEYVWLVAAALQVLSSFSFAAYPFIGKLAFSLGSTTQFSVDVLLVILFKSLNKNLTRSNFAIVVISILTYWAFYDHEDYIHRSIIAVLGLIILSLWQIYELYKFHKKSPSIYLVFLIGIISLQIFFAVFRLHSSINLLPLHGTSAVIPDRFHEDLDAFLLQLPILIGYVLIFFGIDNLFFERLWGLSNKQKKELEQQVVNVLTRLTAARDNNTGKHILRTQEMVKLLAETLSKFDSYRDFLTKKNIQYIYLAAPLHDIGKVAIPDEILMKPGKLDSRERAVIKNHALLGEQILSATAISEGQNPILETAVKLAISHHEYWNGEGYPNGLKGEQIPVEGRIMAVVDVYDALTSHRIYKSGWTHQDAVDYISKNKGIQFDPIVVEAFLTVSNKFEEIIIKMPDPDLGVSSVIE